MEIVSDRLPLEEKWFLDENGEWFQEYGWLLGILKWVIF
jgi:hypothetical protein